MIWPPGKTSIRNRPPLVLSTIVASSWAEPWSISSAGVHVVDIRHWTLGWAITLGAPAIVAATATAVPLAAAMNLRRSVIGLSLSPATSCRRAFHVA
jgi:hypothetical protein